MWNKIKKNCAAVFFSLFIFPMLSYCQIDSTVYSTDDIISEIISESEDDNDLEGLISLIEDLAENPIDLNKAGISDLQKIPGIDLPTAKSIIEHRNRYGDFYSVRELNSVKNIPSNVVLRIIPFVKIDLYGTEVLQNNNTNNFISSLGIRSRVIKDLQPEKGFTNSYSGDVYKSYSQLRLNIKNKYHIGATIDKDPGEKSIYDFISAYLSISNAGIFNKIILGDYLVEFGQGLALWSPYSLSKSADAISPLNKNPLFIKEYKNSDENKFFRGAALDVSLGKLNLSFFYSSHFFDANIDQLTGRILSVSIDGLHRTISENSRKHTAMEKFFGGILTYNIPSNLQLGILHYNSKLSNSFYSSGNYGLEGDIFNYSSIYYKFYYKNIYLSGEHSFNGKSIASIVNIFFELNSRISVISSIRNYPSNYTNLHGSGFGERNGSTKNEIGFYNGIRYRSEFGIFNFYFDQFKFPYSTSGNSFPSYGNEIMVDYKVHPFKYLDFNFRFKNEKKEIIENNDTGKRIYEREKSSLRLDITYTPNNFLRIKSRVEQSRYKINTSGRIENGSLIFQDIRYSPVTNLSLYGRIIFFKTDSFDTAIYEYENDLDGVFSISGLSGEGIRWYFLLKYKFLEFMNLSLKYSELFKPKEKTLGSGFSEISGNFDNRIGIQFEVKF